MSSRLRTETTLKVMPLSSILRLVRAAKTRGQKIVTTNGCFDIVHVGHLRYLAEAKRHGDILIVGINSDASVKQSKGDLRPIIPAKERAELIAMLKPVDAVFIFNERTAHAWLMKVKPHVHVKGGDWTMAQITERSAIEKFGGKLVLANHVKGSSTTNIIGKILGFTPKR